MHISTMRLEKLRQVDLNLLITFAAIAEEKSVTAAASRLLLSQPAISRALQRARSVFQEELLVRSRAGFELTPRGREILDELEGLLPKMERLVAPAAFDPVREKSRFRLSGPDNACTVVLPRLCRRYGSGRYQVHFEFHPWQGGITDLVEHGQLDLILHIDDGLLPSHFQSERLYREEWICAVANDSGFGDSLSLKQYVSADHIVVGTYAGSQTIPDKQLAAVGAKRKSCIRVPYFRRGARVPGGHRAGTDAHQRHDTGCESRPQAAPGEGATRTARVSFPDGVASPGSHRYPARVAPRGDAVSGCGCGSVSNELQ